LLDCAAYYSDCASGFFEVFGERREGLLSLFLKFIKNDLDFGAWRNTVHGTR
jgi:hypothetical protein